ncbi:MAG: methyl-accepting chemotaxis protein [Ruminococcaceae bacterium]|nr:methyl-accepting chemotaxis protein [Oscillospiraceae bacterium]
MNSRIGRKLLISIILCIVLTVAIVNTTTVSMSTSYSDSLMIMHTESGLNILKQRFNDQLDDLSDIYDVLEASDVVTVEGAAEAQEIWDSLDHYESDFAAFYDASGNIFWKTDNYKLGSFSVSKGRNGYSGLVDDSTAGLTMQYTQAIVSEGTVIGTAVVGRSLTESAWLDQVKSEISTEVTVFNGKTRCATTVVNASGDRAVGTDMSAEVAAAVIEKGDNYQGTADILGQKHYVCYEPVKDIDGNIVGALFAGYSSAQSDSLKYSMIITSIIVAVVVAGIALIIISVISIKAILVPIKEAEKLADSMSKGNLSDPDPDYRFANDELGDFVRKLEFTKKTLNEYISDINHVLTEMSVGNFTAEPRIEYIGDFKSINTAFYEIERSLREIIGSIGQSSKDVMMGSQQIAEGSKGLADGTTKQAAAIQELSASLNEIAEKVESSAANATEASSVSRQSSEKIKYQNGEIENMLDAMNEIKERSDKIKNIIKAIDDIAFQTNILALNAAVEAARAGEAGKGFSVVADEVRTLAAKSAESAQQTGTLITATIEAVDKGTEIANTTAEIMKEVIELSARTDAYISDISMAMEEEASSIDQVKVGIEQISTVVQQNSATAEETAASCAELSNQSYNLEMQIDKLKV